MKFYLLQHQTIVYIIQHTSYDLHYVVDLLPLKCNINHCVYVYIILVELKVQRLTFIIDVCMFQHLPRFRFSSVRYVACSRETPPRHSILYYPIG